MSTAQEWIRTDPQACRNDVARLGFGAAVEYEMKLIDERACFGDDRWTGITRQEMQQALLELTQEAP